MEKLIPPVLLMVLWMTFTAAGCKEHLGSVQGKVEFRGVPCQPGQPDFNVPPCSGPYPNYEVVIYRDGVADAPAMSLKTGQDGSFHADLPEGSYTITTQNGPMPDNKKENRFVVKPKETTEVKLLVNTGIL